MTRKLALLALWLVIGPLVAAAGDKPSSAAIASAHRLATEAGHEMFERGGNAFDAAVAVSAALGVVEPNGSGLGGGGFWLLHRQSDGLEIMIDGREVAPQAATRDMYLDEQGVPIPRLSKDSPLAAGIPGQAAGLELLAASYGRLGLDACLQPAIRLAREGFPLYERLRFGLEWKKKLLARSPAAAEVWLRDGEVPPIGTIIRQPDLARTLEQIAERGAEGFYRGAIAEQLVEGVRAGGGIWTLSDLGRYRAVEREPISVEVNGLKIVTAPPPSAGGIALVNALNILSGFDLGAIDSATRKHLVVESLRRAFRDRGAYLGDPDFVDIPVERLTSMFYADGQRTSLRVDRATPSDSLPGIFAEPVAGTQTTHFSVLDSDGNRVAGTMSLNFWFGSGYMVAGTGVMLNNEMDDFSVKAGVPDGYLLVGADANSVEPGKRPLSSMTPTFLESERGLAILGTPGGSRIISMVLLATLEWLNGGDANDMVSLPRYHHQYLPDKVFYEENALSGNERSLLEERGHELQETSRRYGNMEVITWEYETGEVKAASDPRGAGEAHVY